MLTATGIGSGLDIESLVSQLVAAERTPVETRLLNKEAELTTELSAFGAFKGSLSSFQSALTALNTLSTFGQRTAQSSDAEKIAVSASNDAEAGSYNLSVSQLAAAHSLASGSYASASDEVGTGVLTFRFGTTDYTPPDPGPESYNSFTVNPERGVASVTIDSSNNTLEGVRDAINDADIGVSAVIVNDGSGYRLLLGSDQTGADNSIEIAVSDTGDGNDTDSAGLSALAFNSSAINAEQTVAGQDAVFTINGLTINSSTNNADEVIDGVDIELKDLTGAAPVTLTISEDKESVKQAINGLLGGYNGFIGTANNLTAYDPESGSSGALQGDFSVRAVASQLRQVLTSAVESFDGPFNTLAEIGITTTADGLLEVDSDRLDDVLENNFDDIAGLFASVGFPSDSNIDFASASDKTQEGEYSVNISQLATRGQLVGTVAGFPLTIDADNDSFSIVVDGTESSVIAITHGAYATGAELAAELQSRINGDSALALAGKQVEVTFNTDHFEITSESYGSESSVEITSVDTNTASQLGLSVAAGTSGLDVAGTIGGIPATGTGQLLTGADGSALEGLGLVINSGATGDRGTLVFSRGLASQLSTLIDSFLDEDGILDSRTDSLQGQVDDLDDQRDRLDLRIESLEARYRAQFNALDSLLSQLQGTSTFLTQQLASLPQAGSLVGNNN